MGGFYFNYFQALDIEQQTWVKPDVDVHRWTATGQRSNETRTVRVETVSCIQSLRSKTETKCFFSEQQRLHMLTVSGRARAIVTWKLNDVNCCSTCIGSVKKSPICSQKTIELRQSERAARVLRFDHQVTEPAIMTWPTFKNSICFF